MSEKKKIALVVHSGTVDKLLCAFTLGSTAAAMDMEVHLYFTFWGMDIITNSKSLKISPVGNPSLGIPNIIGMIPGMTSIASLGVT